jgi:hypothetical protein
LVRYFSAGLPLASNRRGQSEAVGFAAPQGGEIQLCCHPPSLKRGKLQKKSLFFLDVTLLFLLQTQKTQH